MKTIKIIVFSILLFVISTYLAFYFEESYRKIIRQLFEISTQNNISFFHPRKYFRFASPVFLFSFSIFNLTSLYLFLKQTKKQYIINSIIGLIFFLVFTLGFCYLDSSMKIMECTACNNGKRILGYEDINYNLIFIISLFLTLLPSIITKIRNSKNEK